MDRMKFQALYEVLAGLANIPNRGVEMSVCKKCGRSIDRGERLSLGSGRVPSCSCPRPVARREPSRRETTQNITYVSPAPSIADQLAVLAKLRKEGSLTEQEFQTLKTRLISGGKL